MYTLKDVAELAGVSRATASLALNNKPVNEETRKKVIGCAKKLNYIPNRIGQILITGKSNTIELIIMHTQKYTNIVKETSLYYFLIQGVLKITNEKNYSLRFDIKYFEDKYLYKYYEHKIKDKSLDGIIIVPQFLFDYKFLSFLVNNNFPYIMLCPSCIDKNINLVDINNYYGGMLVAKLFINRNFKKIAFINGPKIQIDAMERERGFIDSLKKAGIEIQDKAKYYGDFTINSGYNGIKHILNNYKPEALFCANDYMAAGAMKYIHEIGLRIPSDISIVGYDNFDIAQALFPPLTTIDLRFEYTGECLASKLIDLINNKKTSVRMNVKPILINRASVLEECVQPTRDQQSR